MNLQFLHTEGQARKQSPGTLTSSPEFFPYTHLWLDEKVTPGILSLP